MGSLTPSQPFLSLDLHCRDVILVRASTASELLKICRNTNLCYYSREDVGPLSVLALRGDGLAAARADQPHRVQRRVVVVHVRLHPHPKTNSHLSRNVEYKSAPTEFAPIIFFGQMSFHLTSSSGHDLPGPMNPRRFWLNGRMRNLFRVSGIGGGSADQVSATDSRSIAESNNAVL